MKLVLKQTLFCLAIVSVVASGVLIGNLSGCNGNQSANAQTDGRAQSLATVNMDIGNKKFVIELALTDDQQQMGLMYRDSMPADHGMIFVFPDEQERSFWMKNTRIPLDIAYLDKTGKVVSIKQMRPFDLTGVNSEKPAKYAIEFNVNVASQAGLKVGDTVKIPDLSPTTKPATAPDNVYVLPSTRP